MNPDLKKELQRKLFHLLAGVMLSFLIFKEIFLWWHFLLLTLAGLAVIVFILHTKKEVPLVSRLIKEMGRKKEHPGFGAVTFVFGAFVATALFSKEIAAASIMILGVGDSVSPIVGRAIGKTKTILSEHKKLEGFVAGTIAATLAALFYVTIIPAFFGAVFAMLAEIWDKTNFIDDNILMPIVAGIVMTFISLL